MFGSLIFRHTLTLSNVGTGYLYIFALMFFYLCVLRTFKSYNTAFIPSIAAAVITAFPFIYDPSFAPFFACALFCGMSFFSYTFTDAQGLKHNQDKHFMLLSLLFYAAALYFSIYSVIMPCFIYIYEFVNKRTSKIFILRKRIYFFLLFAFLAIIIKM